VLNGFPLRLVAGILRGLRVKHLNEITVVDDGSTILDEVRAYRIRTNACACRPPGTAPKATISRSTAWRALVITKRADGAKLKGGRGRLLKGMASTGGYGNHAKSRGIDRGGKTWTRCGARRGLGKC